MIIILLVKNRREKISASVKLNVERALVSMEILAIDITVLVKIGEKNILLLAEC